jgi:hypothetical protein
VGWRDATGGPPLLVMLAALRLGEIEFQPNTPPEGDAGHELE